MENEDFWLIDFAVLATIFAFIFWTIWVLAIFSWPPGSWLHCSTTITSQLDWLAQSYITNTTSKTEIDSRWSKWESVLKNNPTILARSCEGYVWNIDSEKTIIQNWSDYWLTNKEIEGWLLSSRTEFEWNWPEYQQKIQDEPSLSNAFGTAVSFIWSLLVLIIPYLILWFSIWFWWSRGYRKIQDIVNNPLKYNRVTRKLLKYSFWRKYLIWTTEKDVDYDLYVYILNLLSTYVFSIKEWSLLTRWILGKNKDLELIYNWKKLITISWVPLSLEKYNESVWDRKWIFPYTVKIDWLKTIPTYLYPLLDDKIVETLTIFEQFSKLDKKEQEKLMNLKWVSQDISEKRQFLLSLEWKESSIDGDLQHNLDTVSQIDELRVQYNTITEKFNELNKVRIKV